MLCPNCETANREGAKFCDECGFPLPATEAPEVPEATAGEGETAEEAPDAQAGNDGAREPVDEALEPVDAALEPIDDDDFYDEELYAPKEGDTDAFSTQELFVPDEVAGAGPDRDDAGQTVQLEPDVDEMEERLVDSSYRKPEANWRDGDTIQMNPVDNGEPEKSKDYLASSTKKQRNGARIAVIAVVALVVVAAVIALGTYQLNLWGGKPVPDVKGMTEADATSVLEGEGFTVRSSKVKSDDTEGLVLITDPEAGGRVDEGGEVVIHVATARTIPEIIGMTQDEAAKALGDEGFENVKFAKKSSDEPEGQVLEVSPDVGSRANQMTEVTVTVAEPHVVPDVSGMYLEDAIQALQDAGLGYDVVYISTDAYANGQMMGTSPVAGTRVKGGEIVYIQIAQARSVQLEELARQYLAPGSTVTLNGINYVIDSLDSVSYSGNDTVSYSATARGFTQLGDSTAYTSSTAISGTLVFDSSNNVVG